MSVPFHRLLLPLALLSMVSCSSVAYLGQAAKGQISLLLAREPIDALLSEQDIDAELRESLTLILELREFAASELGLPVGSSYESYVQLDRDFVVWNVFAAPEFSVDALTWCYPIAGCVGYRAFLARRLPRPLPARSRRRASRSMWAA